jgi:GntR family transcriptional regulator
LLKNEGLLEPWQGLGTFMLAKPLTHLRMRVEPSLSSLAELYRRQAPRLIALSDSVAMPRMSAEDGLPAPKRFRNEVVIAVLMDLKAVKIGSARQILTISTAGAEAASALNISVSAPVAELTYRGDYIRADMDLLG